MEYFSEDHSNLLLSKEWLVKIDSEKSVPYMLKFYSSTVDLCCYIIVTDTKNVWGEVLQSNQLARRWRDCNPQQAPSFDNDEDEDEWRIATVELLSAAHTIGGIMDLTFEAVKTHYSDFAFELGSDFFKWRWETCTIGTKLSAEVLSKHLIMPLISLAHLGFSSADPVSELSEADLEKTVDKIGRTARRTVDTHVKHAISRPLAATTLRRMTAMFNFSPDLPPILSEVSKPDLRLPSIRPKSRAASRVPRRLLSPIREPPSPVAHTASRAVSLQREKLSPKPSTQPLLAADDSETETESEDPPDVPTSSISKAENEARARRVQGSPTSSQSLARVSPRASRQQSPEGPGVPNTTMDQPTDDSSPPHSPPTKKIKRVESSDEEDSEAERRRRVTQIKSKSQRGAKQPLKRGGKRF